MLYAEIEKDFIGKTRQMIDKIDNISKDKQDEGDLAYDLCCETLYILNTINKDDLLDEAKDKQDDIFKLVNKKIKHQNQQMVPSAKIKLWSIMAIVAVICILVTVGYGFYTIGYKKGGVEQLPTDIVVKAPRGTTTDVILPDHSRVVLNSESSLSYPSYFTNERRVILQGEAYFDIQKDESKPFLLETGNLTVRVLGTRFNMRTYPDEEYEQITLEEGLLDVLTDLSGHESLQLHPNQQLFFNNVTRELKRESITANDFIAWKDGKLVYRDVSLEIIKNDLERRFNVVIEINDAVLKKERYYTSFEQGETLDEILTLLSYKRKWCYKKNGKQITIKKT